MMKSPKTIGEISEIKFAARLIELGYVVLFPWGDNQPYDLVIDLGTNLYKIQVKTGRYKETGSIHFATSTSNWWKKERYSYTKEDIDLFGVYCPELDRCYLISINDVTKTECLLRVDYPIPNRIKNKKKYKPKWHWDYVL